MTKNGALFSKSNLIWSQILHVLYEFKVGLSFFNIYKVKQFFMNEFCYLRFIFRLMCII